MRKKPFDKPRPNGKALIPFAVSLSNALMSEAEGHEPDQRVQGFRNNKETPRV